MSDQVIIAIAAAAGVFVGAVATGLLKAWADRTGRGNKWLEFKRGQARGFMQHIAVHCHEGEVSDDDERLLGHYYTLALAVSKDEGAAALYQELPDHLRDRVHDPGEVIFRHLRSEVTPRGGRLGRLLRRRLGRLSLPRQTGGTS